MGIQFINKDWVKSLTPGRTNGVITGIIQTGSDMFEEYDKPVDSLLIEVTIVEADYSIRVPLYKHFVADLGRKSKLTDFIEGCLGHKLKASEMKSLNIKDLIMLPINVNIVGNQQENGDILYSFTEPISASMDTGKIEEVETSTYFFDINGFENEALDGVPHYAKSFIFNSQEYKEYQRTSKVCSSTLNGEREGRRRTSRPVTQPDNSKSAGRRR